MRDVPAAAEGGIDEEFLMKREQRPLYAIAAAVLVVGLIFAGVPPILLILLACPLAMIFMMRGMDHGGMNHDHDDSQGGPKDPSRDHHSSGR
jgi:hypothetical protein